MAHAAVLAELLSVIRSEHHDRALGEPEASQLPR